MSPFINDSCTALKSFPNRQKRPAKNDKGVELWLVAANVTKPVDFKLKDCMDGFFFAMNNCTYLAACEETIVHYFPYNSCNGD